VKRLRSLLNTPGNRPAMIEKAAGYGPDAVIIDLEDAVPLDQKADARAVTRQLVEDLAGRGLVVYVRVNGPASGLMDDDLDAIACAGLEGVQVPKVDSPDDVRAVDAALTALERDRGLAADGIELLVSLESAIGVLHAHPILTAAPRVGSVMPGTAEHGDLQGDLGFLRTPDETELLYVRSHILLAARAAGLANPIDGVYANHTDTAGFEASARRARQLGYQGKKLIHPRQIEVANRVFSPTPAELAHYERILEVFEAALARGEATAVADGLMVDYAMAETARRALGQAAGGD
jgi:citrate lyase subunit beta/citryl-CoA lyase